MTSDACRIEVTTTNPGDVFQYVTALADLDREQADILERLADADGVLVLPAAQRVEGHNTRTELVIESTVYVPVRSVASVRISAITERPTGRS